MSSRTWEDIFAAKTSESSSPLLLDKWHLGSDLEKIQQQNRPLRRILEEDALFTARSPEVSGWSCGEQAGHAVLVNQLIATVITRLLDSPEIDRDKEPAGFTHALFEQGEFPRGRAKAPKHLLPYDRTRQDFLSLLEETRHNWQALELRRPELSVCLARYPHFVFGYLTPAEWTRFSAIHAAHHLKIAAEVLEKAWWKG